MNNASENKIGHHVVFAPDTIIGQGVTISNNVTFYPGVTVGDGCTIFDGAVIGQLPMTPGNTTRPVDSSFRPLTIGARSIIGANAVLYTGIVLSAATSIMEELKDN